jgi:hypothetical protein
VHQLTLEGNVAEITTEPAHTRGLSKMLILFLSATFVSLTGSAAILAAAVIIH